MDLVWFSKSHHFWLPSFQMCVFFQLGKMSIEEKVNPNLRHFKCSLYCKIFQDIRINIKCLWSDIILLKKNGFNFAEMAKMHMHIQKYHCCLKNWFHIRKFGIKEWHEQNNQRICTNIHDKRASPFDENENPVEHSWPLQMLCFFTHNSIFLNKILYIIRRNRLRFGYFIIGLYFVVEFKRCNDRRMPNESLPYFELSVIGRCEMIYR